MDKIIIFGDSSSFITNILFKKFLEDLRAYKDMQLVAIVDTAGSPADPKCLRAIKIIFFELRKKFFNHQERTYWAGWKFNNLYDLCRKFSIKVIIPPRRNINSIEFIDYLKYTLKPTIGLVIGCPQIFGKDLRETFEILINYHNSLLPRFRGLYATAWSIYFNNPVTGFSFHRVSEKIDGGNVLLQQSMAISEKKTSLDWEITKTFKAGECLKDLLELAKQRAAGTEPQVVESYFGQKEYDIITEIDCPQEFEFTELSKRLQAFGSLKINIRGRYYEVTDFISLAGKEKLSYNDFNFLTQDNVCVQVTRICYLPPGVYKLYEWFKRKNNK